MAQHPFAHRVAEVLAESGVVINDDGTTRHVEPPKQPEQPNVEPEQNNQTTPTTQDKAPELSATEKTLLEMQREQIQQLQSQIEQLSTAKPNEGKSERELELERQVQELQSQINTQQEMGSIDEFRATLEATGFDSEFFDDEALVELRNKLINPVANRVVQMEQQLKGLQDKFREPSPEEKLKQIKAATQAEIEKQIPDFRTIMKSKAFNDKLASKDDRFPNATYGEALQIAYENGNHEFIVREINNFLGNENAQSVNDIADVGASNGVGSKPVENKATGGYSFTDEEAMQMLRKSQRGDITRQEYSDYRRKFEANKASAT